MYFITGSECPVVVADTIADLGERCVIVEMTLELAITGKIPGCTVKVDRVIFTWYERDVLFEEIVGRCSIEYAACNPRGDAPAGAEGPCDRIIERAIDNQVGSIIFDWIPHVVFVVVNKRLKLVSIV